jgi:hypothetical protein
VKDAVNEFFVFESVFCDLEMRDSATYCHVVWVDVVVASLFWVMDTHAVMSKFSEHSSFGNVLLTKADASYCAAMLLSLLATHGHRSVFFVAPLQAVYLALKAYMYLCFPDAYNCPNVARAAGAFACVSVVTTFLPVVIVHFRHRDLAGLPATLRLPKRFPIVALVLITLKCGLDIAAVALYPFSAKDALAGGGAGLSIALVISGGALTIVAPFALTVGMCYTPIAPAQVRALLVPAHLAAYRYIYDALPAPIAALQEVLIPDGNALTATASVLVALASVLAAAAALLNMCLVSALAVKHCSGDDDLLGLWPPRTTTTTDCEMKQPETCAYQPLDTIDASVSLYGSPVEGKALPVTTALETSPVK